MLKEAKLIPITSLAGKEAVATRGQTVGFVFPHSPPLLAPFVPLLRAATPLLLPLGKLVESRFDFYCDDKCTGCGICEHVCLAEKVHMVDGKPIWQEAVQCHGCFACLNYCPEESVQVASRWHPKSHTEQSGRYHHHPEIAAEDIAAQKRAVAS
jgi:NAD-dependent dihydropyrimidine dehydrogenase PreA subunit